MEVTGWGQVLTILALGFMGFGLPVLLVGWKVYAHFKNRDNQFAQYEDIACILCDQTGVNDRGGGSYLCLGCGYDTDWTERPEINNLVGRISQIKIIKATLEAQRVLFFKSRFRYENFNGKNDKVGPIPEYFAEASAAVADCFNNLGGLAQDVPEALKLPRPPKALVFAETPEETNINIKTLWIRFRTSMPGWMSA